MSRLCCCSFAAPSRIANVPSPGRPRALGLTARHGVQRLPEAMAGALAGGVELGRGASAIELADDGAVVTCADGQRFRARHVIAAVPLPVLRRIAIEPRLPASQADAVATLPSQPLTQVYLAPRSRFWEQDGYAASLFTDTRAGMLAAARNRDDPTEVTSLTAWITGDTAAALDRLPPADAGRAVIAAIELLRPAARNQLELIGMHSWGLDACARGAWTYFRPGEVTRFAAALGRAARPTALLRRASRNRKSRHGRRDGVRRGGRGGDPRKRLKPVPCLGCATPRRFMRLGHSGRRS